MFVLVGGLHVGSCEIFVFVLVRSLCSFLRGICARSCKSRCVRSCGGPYVRSCEVFVFVLVRVLCSFL